MKRVLATVIFALLCCVAASAQDKYKVEIKNDQKIINVDALGLPGTMTVSEVLRMLPEILNRTTQSIYENYDVQMNGFSVGNSKEQFVSQTFLSDVYEIVISEDPVTSYQSNGHGGSINFKLRQQKEGASGKVNLSAYLLNELLPTLQFNYNRKKFSFYAWAAYDLYRPATTFEDKMVTTPELTYSSDTTKQRIDYQMLRMYMKYTPTEKDELSVQFFQTYSKEDYDYAHCQIGSPLIEQSAKDNSALSLSTNLKYSHQFLNSKLTAEARYEYNPSRNAMTFGSNRFYNMDNKVNNFSGKLDYKYTFVPRGKMKEGSVTAGANFKMNGASNLRHEEFNPGLGNIIKDADISGNSTYVSPYLKTEWAIGIMRLMLSAEYQMYNYSIKEVNAEPFSKQQNDFTGKFIAGFQVAPHHHVRFLANRSIRRPSNFQVYPYPVYDVANRYYFKGSTSMNPEETGEIGLDYITDHTSKQGDFFMLNVNASYIHVDGKFGTSAVSSSSEFGYPYMVYENNGTNDILKASAMVLYSVGRLSVSFSGNIFNNNIVVKGVPDHYSYYSLAILPSLGFNNNWSLALSAMYSSPVNTRDSELGQSSFVHLRVSKSWDNIVLSFQGFLPLSARATDLSIDSNGMFSVRRYLPYQAYLGFDASWRF